MRRHGTQAKLVAAALALSVSGLTGSAFAGSGSATLSGRVLAAGSGLPLQGWTVLVGNPKTKTIESTATTDAEGSFTVADLPPATYEVAVRSGDTLYPANGAVPLAPGQARDIQLAVNQQAAPPPGPSDEKPDGTAAWWNNPVVATLLVVGGAIVVGLIVDNASDDEQPASPSNPL